jgi:hypothetical protein
MNDFNLYSSAASNPSFRNDLSASNDNDVESAADKAYVSWSDPEDEPCDEAELAWGEFCHDQAHARLDDCSPWELAPDDYMLGQFTDEIDGDRQLFEELHDAADRHATVWSTEEIAEMSRTAERPPCESRGGLAAGEAAGRPTAA